MSKFKVGDRVRCIDADGCAILTVGKEYDVVDVWKSDVWGDGHPEIIADSGYQGGWYARQFELVKDESKKSLDQSLDYLKETLTSFQADPASSDYQEGYETALMDMLDRVYNLRPKVETAFVPVREA